MGIKEELLIDVKRIMDSTGGMAMAAADKAKQTKQKTDVDLAFKLSGLLVNELVASIEALAKKHNVEAA